MTGSATGAKPQAVPINGIAGWLLNKLSGRTKRQPRLTLLERISLAPKQSLALVEAEGRRFLVATSADGSPALYALGMTDRTQRPVESPSSRTRVSW